jgi:hypothetical protein
LVAKVGSMIGGAEGVLVAKTNGAAESCASAIPIKARRLKAIKLMIISRRGIRIV